MGNGTNPLSLSHDDLVSRVAKSGHGLENSLLRSTDRLQDNVCVLQDDAKLLRLAERYSASPAGLESC